MDWFEMINRRMAEAPALATLWDTDRRMFASTMAFARWQAAQAEVSRVMDEATRQAQARFVERLKARSETASADSTALRASMEDGFDLWLSVLNEAMLDTMRGEAYLAAQRRLVETGLEFRESLAVLADEACQWFQLPSRSDFDDLARSVTELKREVRALARNRAAGPDRPASQEGRPPKADGAGEVDGVDGAGGAGESRGVGAAGRGGETGAAPGDDPGPRSRKKPATPRARSGARRT